MSRITSALLALVVLALAAPAGAAAAPRLVPVGSFTTPMYVASPPRDPSRLFVVERAGVIVKLGRVRTSLRGGHRTILRLRPTRRGAKKIRATLKRNRRATLVVSVAAGNTGHAKRRMKFRCR